MEVSAEKTEDLLGCGQLGLVGEELEPEVGLVLGFEEVGEGEEEVGAVVVEVGADGVPEGVACVWVFLPFFVDDGGECGFAEAAFA